MLSFLRIDLPWYCNFRAGVVHIIRHSGPEDHRRMLFKTYEVQIQAFKKAVKRFYEAKC